MDATIRKPRTDTGPELCPLCRKPGHPSETDDYGKHPECVAKERGIVP